MKALFSRLKSILASDFVIAFLVLVLFLATNRYIYGWDDQHLEIPLLKHLIDPALYAGDYYVESLSRHFSTYLYPILSSMISVDMIPSVYFVLYCLSRFFFFYWVYRLWQVISKDRLTAFFATIALFLLGRTEEFIYRTFSHEEFALAIIFAGIYFFYRERFVLAAVLLGIAANFHALYALFPMIFLAVYALIFIKDKGKTFLKTSACFVLAALPFLLWHLPRAFGAKTPVPVEEWMPLYLQSCPQCFPLGSANPKEVITGLIVLLQRLYPYLFLAILYLAHCILNEDFRKDKKTQVIFWVSAFFIVLGFYFAYVQPSRFMLDLNLGRLAQFIHFFLLGYTVVYLVRLSRRDHMLFVLIALLAFVLIGFADTPSFVLRLKRNWGLFVAIAGFMAILFSMKNSVYVQNLKKFALAIPLIWMFGSFCVLHYNFVQLKDKGSGFWQLQRNWEDMQFYVRDHTPKDAMVLTPIDMEMGGFRIHSNRKVVVCYRDCGVIGFDFTAAKEWERRMKDVEAFKVMTREDIRPALITAVQKFGANYIVFMRYYEPQQEVSFLKKLYANDIFSLYQVVR